MFDDLVQHVRREIALDGASGCTWERFWYLIATEQERLLASSPLAKNKTPPQRRPDALVPDEKYRRYFWDFFLRIKGPVYYLYEPPAGAGRPKKLVSEAWLLPMEHLKPIPAGELSYDQVVTRYHDTLRIAPTIEARNEAICGISSSTISISGASLELLQLIVSMRERGISQSLLSKELGKDSRTIFHHVKTLIKANLLVKFPISEAGIFTQLVLFKPLAHLHPGYSQWVAENKASSSSSSAIINTTTTTKLPAPTTDDGTTHPDGSYYNSIAKMRIINLLRKAKGNIMVMDDLAIALGLPPKGQRTVQQYRFLIRISQQLQGLGHIVRVNVEGHGRCVQLAPHLKEGSAGTLTSPPASASSSSSSTATAAANAPAAAAVAGDLMGATSEPTSDAQLDVNQLIAKEASSRRGIELGTSFEYQIVRFVVQSGATGVTQRDIREQFAWRNHRLLDKLMDSMTKKRKAGAIGGSGSTALLRRVSELNGRQHVYRFFSTRNYENSIQPDYKEYIEKKGMASTTIDRYERSKKNKALKKTLAAAGAGTGTGTEPAVETETGPTVRATASSSTPPSSSGPSRVAAPNVVDTIPAVDAMSPSTSRLDTATTMDVCMPPPPPPSTPPSQGKGKGKALSTDSSAATPREVSTTGSATTTTTTQGPNLKNVDLSALERREILLEMINERRILEYGQVMINEYQAKLQARYPNKKLTVIDRKTLYRYANLLEGEGKCKTIFRSTVTATGNTLQRRFLIHADADPESEKIRMYIEGCLNLRTVFLAAGLRWEKKGKVEVEVERLQELSERLQEEMPQPLALPAHGLLSEGRGYGANNGGGGTSGASGAEGGEGGAGVALPPAGNLHFEQIASRYGWRKPKMVRVRHFHEYVFRTTQAIKGLPEDQDPIIKTIDLFGHMPLHVFLISIGVDKEPESEEQSLWLLENASSEMQLKDLPLGLSYLSEPTTFFKRRMRELFEMLDALELVAPLLLRNAGPINQEQGAMHPTQFFETKNHLALSPFYRVHLWVDPGLVRLVKVETETRMKLQSTMDVQNYWITVMRVTQYATAEVKEQAGGSEAAAGEDGQDEEAIDGDGDGNNDLLTDLAGTGKEGGEDGGSGGDGTGEDSSSSKHAGQGSDGAKPEMTGDAMIFTVINTWGQVKARLLRQVYHKRTWTTLKAVTRAQGLILDRFARYPEQLTPVHSPELLAKAAHAAGVATYEAKKHYLTRLYYSKRRTRMRLGHAADSGGGGGDEQEGEQEVEEGGEKEGGEGSTTLGDALSGAKKGQRQKKPKGKTQRLASTRALVKKKNKGKKIKIEEEEDGALALSAMPRVTRHQGAKGPGDGGSERRASSFEASSEDENDRDYKDKEDGEEEEVGEEEEEEEEEEEKKEENVMLHENDKPKQRRRRRVPWSAQDDDRLMVLDALAHHVSMVLHTRKSWKGISVAFPGRSHEPCRRRLGVLKRNPINASLMRLYRKKWTRIFTKEDRARYLNENCEIKDAIGLLKVWAERQEFVHVAEDVADESGDWSRRHLDSVDLPLHVNDLLSKYTVVSSAERMYTMFYVDDKDLPRLSQPQQIAAVAAWPSTLRAVVAQELDLRLDELEDLPVVNNRLEELLLPKVPKATFSKAIEAREDDDDEEVATTTPLVVMPSGREKFRDEQMVLTLWKAVFHLPGKEVESNSQVLRDVLSYFPPDVLSNASALGREWRVMTKFRFRGSRIPGQPLVPSERFLAVMLGAISRVRSNNAAEFLKMLFPPVKEGNRRHYGGSGGGVVTGPTTKLDGLLRTAQFEFDPMVNASQMMAMIHALEGDRLVFSASPTDLTALDQDVMPMLTVTVVDKHPILPMDTTIAEEEQVKRPFFGDSDDDDDDEVKTTTKGKMRVMDKGNAHGKMKKRKEADGEEGEAMTEAKKPRDNKEVAVSPQFSGVYRSWTHVLEVAKTELYKYLATVPDAGRRELFGTVYEIVAATGSQGILMIDLKDTILKIHLKHAGKPTDEQISEAVWSMERLFPPALVKVGFTAARYVASGFQLPWMVDYHSSKESRPYESSSSVLLEAEALEAEVRQGTASLFRDAGDGQQRASQNGGEATAAATTTDGKSSSSSQYTQVNLRHFWAPRMWRTMKGEWNAVTFEKLCHSVLTHIVQRPGISRGNLERAFDRVVMPVELDEILEDLERRRGAIVARRGIMPPRSTLFTPRALFRPCGGRSSSNGGGGGGSSGHGQHQPMMTTAIDRRMVTMFFPNHAQGKAYFEYLDMALVRTHHSEDLTTRTAQGLPRLRDEGARGSAGSNGRVLRRQQQQQQQQQQATEAGEENGEAEEGKKSKKKKRSGKIQKPRGTPGRPIPEMFELLEPMLGASEDEGVDPEEEQEKEKKQVGGVHSLVSVATPVAASGSSDGKEAREQETVMQVEGEEEEDEGEEEEEEDLVLNRRGRVLHSDIEDVEEEEDEFAGVVDDEDEQPILDLDLDLDDEDLEEDYETEQPGYGASDDGAPAHKKPRSSA